MRMFAKDIAKTLGKPEGPLLQAIQMDKVRPYLFDESDTSKEIDMRCPVICQKPEAPHFLQPCGHPIAWNSGRHRCVEHLFSRPSVPVSLPVLRVLEYTKDGDPLYVSEDATVYTAENIPVGQLQEGVLTLFVIDE